MQFPKASLQLIAHVIKKRGWIELPAQGTSMYPFIQKGDICHFISTERVHIKKGDILLFHTPQGSLVAHRFCRYETSNQQLQFLCKGDSNLATDEAIAMDHLIGKMAWISRSGRIIHVKSLTAYVWGRAVLSFPVISRLLRLYLNRRESVQG